MANTSPAPEKEVEVPEVQGRTIGIMIQRVTEEVVVVIETTGTIIVTEEKGIERGMMTGTETEAVVGQEMIIGEDDTHLYGTKIRRSEDCIGKYFGVSHRSTNLTEW